MWTKLRKPLITRGCLKLQDAEGREHCWGTEGHFPLVSLRYTGRASFKKLLRSHELLRKSFARGEITFLSGNILDLLTMRALSNLPTDAGCLQAIAAELETPATPAQALRRTLQDALLGREGCTLYGYFTNERESLDEAVQRHFRHIASQAQVEAGMQVLVLNDHAGSFGLYLARELSARVTCLTPHDDQARLIAARAQAQGVAQLIELQHSAASLAPGRFNRVIAAGFLAGAPSPQLIAPLLAPHGMAYLSCISAGTGLAPLLEAADAGHLWLADAENMQHHAVLTLEHWRARFETHCPGQQEIDIAALRDFSFQLAMAECMFSLGRLRSYGLKLARDFHSLALSRDEAFERERALAFVQRPTPQRRYALH